VWQCAWAKIIPHWRHPSTRTHDCHVLQCFLLTTSLKRYMMQEIFVYLQDGSSLRISILMWLPSPTPSEVYSAYDALKQQTRSENVEATLLGRIIARLLYESVRTLKSPNEVMPAIQGVAVTGHQDCSGSFPHEVVDTTVWRLVALFCSKRYYCIHVCSPKHRRS
jgi:hypothetical protein